MKNIAALFKIENKVEQICPLGNGLINDSFLVATSGNAPDYVLQKINTGIFPDVEALQRNIDVVTNHIRKKLENEGEKDIDRKVLRFIPAVSDGKTYSNVGSEYWRMSEFIEGSKTIGEVTPSTAEAAGLAFGRFESMLSDCKENISEIIPDFHTMSWRLRQLDDALNSDRMKRAADLSELLGLIEEDRDLMCLAENLHKEGKLPKRICHCDTKVNNMLFDENDNVLCVIDLDTVMPSFVFSDFGDFLRTAACTAAEDEPDLEKIDFRMDIFAAFSEGYLKSTAEFLTPLEKQMLPIGTAMFPFMQGVRFLTDWLDGDRYYKISYPEHNLVRARAQFQLYRKVRDKLGEMNSLLEHLPNQ